MSLLDGKAVDESRLDAFVRGAAAYIRDHGAPVDLEIVAAELHRLGCSPQEATDVIEQGLRAGVLVMLGSTAKLDAGFVTGRLT